MKTKFLDFISKFKYISIIYILVAIITSILKYINGPGSYNNYLIFKNVFYHTIDKLNLYAKYPEAYFDVNHYGIIFSIIIAPFAILPDWLGIILWNVVNTVIFLYAIKSLPFSVKNKSFFAWLCLQEFITAAFSFQFNIALTGLIILSATFIYKKKEIHSAFAIMVGTFVKLYGIVGLSSFFFIKNKIKFILSLVGFSIVLFLLPMLISSVDFGTQSYIDWYIKLVDKNINNQTLGNYQDISLMGFVRRIIGNANLSNLLFLGFGLPLFALPYIRINQYKYTAFRIMILSSTLLFTVLFSSGSESPTYIIAVSGVMLWFIIQQKKTKLTIGLLIFTLLLTCFSSTDIVPTYIRVNYIIAYSLKALPCCLIWFRVIYELLTKDFSTDYKLA